MWQNKISVAVHTRHAHLWRHLWENTRMWFTRLQSALPQGQLWNCTYQFRFNEQLFCVFFGFTLLFFIFQCTETITKSCRCGLHQKEVQCKKPYLCETKCKRMKDCNKHPCNRKVVFKKFLRLFFLLIFVFQCCDGNCPPCEKPCARTLNCGSHKCPSICHRGPCYPCNLTEIVACRCGTTKITVPCGRKQKTKPPKCLQLCT